MDNAIREKRHFVLETPLSHPDYWKYIDRFERHGYQIQLNYLCLDKVKDCKLRVRNRVLEGGHDVDAQTIKGVYEVNLKYINDFRDTFAAISLYDGMGIPKLLAKLIGNQVVIADPKALRKNSIKAGLPAIAQQLESFLELQKKQRKLVNRPRLR